MKFFTHCSYCFAFVSVYDVIDLWIQGKSLNVKYQSCIGFFKIIFVSNLICGWKSLSAFYLIQVKEFMGKYCIFMRCFYLVLGSPLECFMKK